MIKILVTGSNGQLGSEIKDIYNKLPNSTFTFTDLEHLDITQKNELTDYFESNNFDFVVNCAAFTNVDGAESDKKNASFLNSTAPKNLAELSIKYNYTLIHISTDYVFNGRNHIPYKEDDKTDPVSIYGKTKLAGEQEILKTATDAVIIRTSWLYSSYNHNFVKTMIKYGTEKGKLNVVFDQIGSPTYARDLADAIIAIIASHHQNKPDNNSVYHYTNSGIASWYDFAHEIIKLCGIDCVVSPIETKDYPLPATRPFYGVLNKSKIQNTYNITIPHWKDSLRDCIEKII